MASKNDTLSIMDYRNEFNIATNIAREAGLLLKNLSQKDLNIQHKGAVDLLTIGDLAAEKLIIEELKKHFDYVILSEESSPDEISDDYMWIIDPLDGTTNYAHRFPVYAVSIGLAYRKKPVMGVVYEPNRDEMFTAIEGEGAFLNGREIEVSKISKLDDALLSTGFPYNLRQFPDATLQPFNKFVLKVQGIRRAGAASVDICYTACGRFDGFWELGLNPWDSAAASLILEEAGGKITKYDNSDFSIFYPEMLASNSKLHKHMLEVLRKDNF